MQSILEVLRKEKLYLHGSLYVIISVIAFGIINFFTWSPGSETKLTIPLFLLWVLIYAPTIIFNKLANWKISEFEFSLNTNLLIFIGITLLLSGWVYIKNPEIWMLDRSNYSLIEAFARTGEEVHFRGFTYLLVLYLFKEKKSHTFGPSCSQV